MKLQGNKYLFLLMCICLPVWMQAQQFHYQCITDTVKQTGFYSIPITPEMSGYMQTDYRDVRIWNEKKQQIPYIIRTRKPKWENKLFNPFKIVENKLDDSSTSIIVFEKNIDKPISELWVIQKNSAVLRQASLSGSNDQKNWFIIQENILLNDAFETLADSNFQPIRFTPSNYNYFRLKIDNEKQEPLNIAGIGYYKNEHYKPEWNTIYNPDPQIIQTDSNNSFTYVKIIQNQPYHVSGLGFEISGQKFFSRDLQVLVAPDMSHLEKKQLTEITRYTLSIGTLDTKEIPVFKSKEFYLVIYNGDNPPMIMETVHTSQKYHELIAWLESGKQYTMMMDANDAVAPTYDLQQFQDSIPAVVTQLAVGKIQPVSTVVESDKKVLFPQKWLWLIMAGAVILLAMLTWRLTGEMRKKES